MVVLKSEEMQQINPGKILKFVNQLDLLQAQKGVNTQ